MRCHRLGRIAAGLVAAGFAMPALPAEGPTGESFMDPTAQVTVPANLAVGKNVYVGPFATIDSTSAVVVGNESNIQDSVTVRADIGPVTLGDQVILAHGATVAAKSRIGTQGTCPIDAATRLPKAVCPSFVSFNAVVENAIVEKDAMVSALAKVGSGVRIPSGRKVLPGKFVAQPKQVAAKTVEVTEADRLFMEGVIHVNVTFANQYPVLAREVPNSTTGINFDPGHAVFNETRDLPTLAGVPTQAPTFRNRIIGNVALAQDLPSLSQVMGSRISLRADEGEGFHVGTIASMGDATTFHALEESHIDVGHVGRYGARSIVHSGATPFGDAEFEDNVTVAGHYFTLGEGAVFFRSRAADGVTIGDRSVVQQCDLEAGRSIAPRTVLVCDADRGKPGSGTTVVFKATVEWE